MANRPYTPLLRAPEAWLARKGAGDTTQPLGVSGSGDWELLAAS
jgi:hypothetical protein